MRSNDVFVQRNIRSVKLRQMTLAGVLACVILIGDAIQANQWLVLEEMKGYHVRVVCGRINYIFEFNRFYVARV